MIEENNQQPLVSIIVITYNSSEYVLETLESAKTQTYQNIELIVSDDCSTDNTVARCNEWLENNNERFVNSVVITVEKNTGIPSNCNRGLNLAKGEWTKFIAGDDALLDNCISSNIDYINEESEEVSVLHSDVYYYSEIFNESNFLFKSEKGLEIISDKHINALEQLSMFVRGYVPLAPSVFFKRSILLLVNGFDETLPYEDGPMWVKLASNNIKLYFLDAVTVKYRLHDSVSNSNGNELIFRLIYKMDKIVFEKVYQSYLSFLEIFSSKATFIIKDLFTRHNLNRRTYLNLFLFKFLNWPFHTFWRLNVKAIIIKIKRRIQSVSM